MGGLARCQHQYRKGLATRSLQVSDCHGTEHVVDYYMLEFVISGMLTDVEVKDTLCSCKAEGSAKATGVGSK